MSEGDTFVPYVFAVALVYALRITRKNPDQISFTLSKPRNRQHPATTLCYNEFSDDIALNSNSLQQVEALLQLIKTVAEQIGMHINEKSRVHSVQPN